MTTSPVGDILTIAAHEYDKPCETPDCEGTADWNVWVSHGSRCRPVAAFRCAPCKDSLEEAWIAYVRTGHRCICGDVPTGQLSDNFRAIRL